MIASHVVFLLRRYFTNRFFYQQLHQYKK